MKKFHIDKSSFFLIVIMLIVVVTAAVLVFAMRPDPIAELLKSDQLFKVLLVLEDEGKPLITNVLIYYPGSRRAAIFDIPGETGLIINELGRVDRIDALYEEKGVDSYCAEIEKLLGIDIPFHLVMNMDEFSALTDLLGGLKVFIPSPVDVTADSVRYLLPSGAVTLDGDKIRTYLTYTAPDDMDGEAVERRQYAIVAFIQALGDDKNVQRALKPEYISAIDKNIRANVDNNALNRLLAEISRADAERLVPQRIQGSRREVAPSRDNTGLSASFAQSDIDAGGAGGSDAESQGAASGQVLLFPLYDGQLIKDIVKQTIGSLGSLGDVTHERIYAIEVLNGTAVQGLARNTSILYQSFGYDVVNVANADTGNYAETVIIDHIGNQTVAKNLGELIKCDRFKPAEITLNGDNYSTDSLVDFTIILGKDFDGRYVK